MTTPGRQHTVVAAAVESLRPEHRQVLLKAYFQGAFRIAGGPRLGLPLPVVKRRIYEAMLLLRQILAQEGLPLRAVMDRGPLAA